MNKDINKMTKKRKPYFPRCCNTTMDIEQVHKPDGRGGEHIVVFLKCLSCGNELSGRR